MVERSQGAPEAATEGLIVPDLLRGRLSEDPDATALVVDRGPTLTYRQWEARSNAVGRSLVARRVGPGDRVALVFDNAEWTDYAVGYLATHKAGAVAVPLGPRFAGPELLGVLRHCGASGVIATDRLARDFAPELETSGLPIWLTTVVTLEAGIDTAPFPTLARPDDLAEILYTSGTTGLPKGVACTHRAVLFQDPPPDEPGVGQGQASFVHAFPIGTNAGQEVLRVPLRRADRTAVALAVFDPERYCAVVAERRVRRLQLVPAMAELLVRSGAPARHDVSSVERVVVSSAPSSPALLAALAAAFPNAALWNTYALTEAGTARTLLTDAVSRPGSVGRPVGATELLVVDDHERHPVPPGTPGDIWIRRPDAPPRSYYRDPEATAATFPGDGWVRTGDVGYVDTEGYLYLVDRKKDLIIVGGLNVSSVEVEQVLLQHPAVAEAAVFAVPHRILGQDVAAAVVASSAVAGPELQAFVRDRLGEHKVPHRLFLVDQLPRTATGKVSKYRLREQYSVQLPSTPFAEPRDEVERVIVAIWESVLGQTPVGVHDDFFDLGGHSLAAAQILARIHDATGISLPLSAIFESPTPADLATLVHQSEAGTDDLSA
jgi:acyl-CoA synthetase (AMP-forming)/AMP-acid ligase II/acyl carrier protein